MERFILNNETGKYHIKNRSFDEFHGITLAFITMNEEKDIVGFIKHIRPYVDKVVMVDGGSKDLTVELAAPLVDSMNIVPFTGHLGNQKNIAISMVETDWTLFLDPDERLSEKAIDSLHRFINQDEYDCYSFPRREFLSGVENKEVYPDYQDRLFRTYCRYVRPIHHELVGYKSKCIISKDDGLDIAHSKELSRHASRNHGHNVFEVKFKYEMSYPGAQLKDTFEKEFQSLNQSFVKKEKS